MVACYDFDIQWLIPRESEADPAIRRLLDDIGFDGNARGHHIALFRDPQIIAMIERADPVLREYLKASGFGFITFQSGAPAGHYPSADGPARADVVTRLNENLARFELKGADLGGFDFAAFLKAITEGHPLPSTNADTGPRVAPDETGPDGKGPRIEPEFMAMPVGFAKLTGRNRVMPLMVLLLAATLGLYWLIEQIQTAPTAF